MSALLLAALAAVVGGASAAAQGRVRTIAEVPSPVSAFAHSDRYFAWIVVPPTLGCARVTMEDVRTGARTSMRERCSIAAGHPGTMVLAGDRAYWEALGASNLTEYSTLMRASARTRKVDDIGFQSIFNEGIDRIVPPASDGRRVYFPESPEDGTPGPIYRNGERGFRRMTRTIRGLSALGAGEDRWAFARAQRTFDCAREPAWSPRGDEIAFGSGGTSYWYRSGRACRGGLWAVHAGTLAVRRVAPMGRNPDWSPDASKLAYEVNGAIVVAESTGAKARTVIARGTDPAWSPDGLRLAFTRGSDVLVANADGIGERIVLKEAKEPDWSPDGSYLVFARTAKATPGLGILELAGGNIRSLTTEADTEPAWSPDGLRIAFVRCPLECRFEGPHIFTVVPDGTAERARTYDSDETADLAPSWRPDSVHVVFERSRAWQDLGDPHIFVGSRQMTRTPPPRTPVVVRSSSGRNLARFTPEGEAVELAVTRRLTAALTRGDGWKLELLRPKQRPVTLGTRLSTLSASGYRVVFLAGRRIVLYDVRARRLSTVARASRPPIGLSIVGRRIAWAENFGKRAWIRSVTLPR